MQDVLKCFCAITLNLLKGISGKAQAVTLNREAVSECEALLALMKLHTPATCEATK